MTRANDLPGRAAALYGDMRAGRLVTREEILTLLQDVMCMEADSPEPQVERGAVDTEANSLPRKDEWDAVVAYAKARDAEANKGAGVTPESLRALVDRWRRKARELSEDGLVREARIYDRCANALEEAAAAPQTQETP